MTQANVAQVPVFKPLIEEDELSAARRALEGGWLGMGSFVGEFENALHEYIGAGSRRVVAVSTGHAALHLALLLAGVGPGDEVLTPAFNNIADFQAILATGAQPVFCDIDDRSLCLDLEDAASLIGPRTKAMIVMDYGCHVCDHTQIASLADSVPMRIVHDAAHSFGSTYHGSMVGSFSDICMFSFDPVKTITCIDGGALVVQTEDELQRLHAMRLIGMTQPSSVMYQNRRAWTYDVGDRGFRYHLANLHAAVGLVQLGKMDQIITSRREACCRYNANLSDVIGLRLPDADFDSVAPFLYYVRVLGGHRDDFREHLAKHGIDTGIHWQPGHWLSLFRDCRRSALPVTDAVGQQIVSLPLHSNMPMSLVDRICDVVRSYFRSVPSPGRGNPGRP